jgi:hypothetical protein
VDLADSALWPLVHGPERARWATQAVERYLRMPRINTSRAAALPAAEAPSPRHTLDLAQQLYDAIERRVSEPDSPLPIHQGAATR